MGMGPTRGTRTDGDPAPNHKPRDPRSLGFRPPASRGSGQGQSGSALALPDHPHGKGGDTFPTSPALCMQGGSGWVPLSHLGGGHPGEREDGKAIHPESGPAAEPVILLPGLWR